MAGFFKGNQPMNRVRGAARRLVRAALPWVLLGLVLPMSATAASNDDRTPAPAAASADGAAGTTIDELHRHMDAHDLTELRTTYNGSYGASLLFYPEQLQYYVVLFHNKDFWRVIKTDAVGDAEKVYATFVAQTHKLAQVDIDAIRLQAGKRFTEHQLQLNRQRLDALNQDLARQHQQAQQVAQQQQQAQQEAVSLSGQLRSSSSQLQALQQRIQALEAQQSDPSLALPPAQQQQSTAAQTAGLAPAGTASSGTEPTAQVQP